MTSKILNILDVRRFSCPLNSVHVRLRLDQIPEGTLLTILLKGDETYYSIRSLLLALHHSITEEECLSPSKKEYSLKVLKN